MNDFTKEELKSLRWGNDIYALDYHQANDFISQLNKQIN